MGDHEGTLQNECDDISKGTKLSLSRFGGTFGTLRFNGKSFSNTLLGFTPYWDKNPTNAIHADGPGAYVIEKFLNSSTKSKTQLKCDGLDGSVVNGSRQTILYSYYIR